MKEFIVNLDPTTEKTGLVEHWICAGCDTYLVLNANGELVETTASAVVIPVVSTPVTGDNTSLIVLVALMVISAMGVAVIFTKKRAI